MVTMSINSLLQDYGVLVESEQSFSWCKFSSLVGILSPQSCSSSFLHLVSAAAFTAAAAEQYCKAWRDACAACSHRTERSEENEPDMPDVHIFPLQLWLHTALETLVERKLFILSPFFFFLTVLTVVQQAYCAVHQVVWQIQVPHFPHWFLKEKHFYRHVFWEDLSLRSSGLLTYCYEDPRLPPE